MVPHGNHMCCRERYNTSFSSYWAETHNINNDGDNECTCTTSVQLGQDLSVQIVYGRASLDDTF